MARNTEAAKAKKKPAEKNGVCMRFDCIYHPVGIRRGSCDYILRTGHRRGCTIKDCDKYKTGAKTRRTKIASFEKEDIGWLEGEAD